MAYKHIVAIVLRVVILALPLHFVFTHDIPTFWLFAIASVVAACFSPLQAFDRLIGNERIATGLRYLLWLVFVYLFYRFASPYIYTGVKQAIEAGKNFESIYSVAKIVVEDFRRTLEGYVTPETIEAILKAIQEYAKTHGSEWALLSLGIGKSLLLIVTVFILGLLLSPVIVFVLYGKREGLSAGALWCTETLCDGTNGSVTRLVKYIWEQHILGVRNIFWAISVAMVIFSVVYWVVLQIFQFIFPGNLPQQAHALYSGLLGILGGVPLIGGMINWATISYVGFTVYGIGWPLLLLFVSQMLIHKAETGYVTPMLLSKYMHVPITGMVVCYAMALGQFGANATGFAASFLFISLYYALLMGLEKWKNGEFDSVE